MREYSDLIKACDEHIRNGHIGRAVKLIHDVNTAQVPRKWRLPLAQVCRRTGQLATGLRLLARELETADPGELSEYAVLLQRNGSTGEALAILSNIDAEKAPESLLYSAFCLFNQWRYDESIPLLERYIAMISAPYPRLVGQVNLAAALAMCRRHDHALANLNATLAECRTAGHRRLEANCLELRAQVYVQMELPDRARAEVDAGLAILDSKDVHDTMFLTKWLAIIEARVRGTSEPLYAMRAEALRRGLSETLREADLQILRAHFDPSLYERLLFGTPFPAFHARIERETGIRPLISRAIIGDRAAPPIDILTGERDGAAALKPGSKAHQVIEILSRDLYRPAKIGALFAELFPGEFFDIFSSPDRVHQILSRTRASLKEAKLSIAIDERDGSYRLAIGPGASLLVPLTRVGASWHEVQYSRLSTLMRAGELRAAGILREELALSESEFKRFVRWALAENRIAKVGGGRSTCYRMLGGQLRVALHG